MVIDGTDGPFAPVIYHRWSGSPHVPRMCPAAPGHGGSSEPSKGCFWPCLLPLRREERNQRDRGERAGKWELWGCSDLGRSCSWRGESPSCPGDRTPCQSG